MDNNGFERAVANRKLEEQAACRQRASAIVNGQPIVNGMRIMDAAAEEIFQIILSKYDGNEGRLVHDSYNVFPTAYRNSWNLEFEKLNMYGVLSTLRMTLGSWTVVLTLQGLTYFEDKEKAQQKEADQVLQFMKNKTNRRRKGDRELLPRRAA